jgi:hypothetical protein
LLPTEGIASRDPATIARPVRSCTTKRSPKTSVTRPLALTMPLVEASLAIAVGLVGAMVTVGRVIETAAAPPPAPSAIRTAAAAASGALP